jgi:hypothetical protein
VSLNVLTVVHILIKDAVLELGLLYQLKPASDQHKILVQSSLPVVRSVETCCETVYMLNKVAQPLDANLTSAACSQDPISHITYRCVRGRRSALAQIQYISDNHLPLYPAQFLRVGLAIASDVYTSASAAERCFRHIVNCRNRSIALDLFDFDRGDSKLNICLD